MYDQLHIDLSSFPIVLSESAWMPPRDRQRLAEFMFESLDATAVSMQLDTVLSLYASGRSTGVVLECGDSMSCTQAIYEGVVLPGSLCRGRLAGSDLSKDLLAKLGLAGGGTKLHDSCDAYTTAALMDVGYSLKHGYGLLSNPAGAAEVCASHNVCPTYNCTMQQPDDAHYYMPDSSELLIPGESAFWRASALEFAGSRLCARRLL